jgi:arylsulfatase A-like enzyme
MAMQPTIRILRAVMLCAACAAPCQANADGLTAPSPKPNVVVFLADDAGWGDYHLSGNLQASMPNIDSLAKGGVSLERFFVCPVCSPTRAEFLTGRYHPRGGVRGVSTGQERLDLDEKTVADAFRAAGYATGAFGKWHNGSQWPYHPVARGFDECFGHTAGHWGEYFDAPLEDSHGRIVCTSGYIVDVCTDRAIDFIERNRERPFLCYIPFTTPHSPWAVPEEYWRRFQNKPIAQRSTQPDQENLDHTRCALAMLANQDSNVGRVLAKLDQLQLTQNTIVLYFSDNGPNTWRWNGGMKGRKGSTDDGGVRSVCYFRWPGRLPAGSAVTQISAAIDLLPTLTSLAGITPASEIQLDGRDLSPLLLGEPTEWPERMIFTTWAGRVSVRTQQHRLDDRGQLFDMFADPAQTTPINRQQHALAAELNEAVQAWRREMFTAEEDSLASANRSGRRRGAATGGVNEVDPRPIPVGFREFPITMLPARDGEPLGGIRRSSGAPNCSYFVNWTSKEDSIVWSLAVETTGQYDVSLDYTCPEADAGATIEASFGTSRVSGQVMPSWDPPLYTNQDTLPRPPGESQMKEFRTLKLGTMTLEAGQGPLTLRALRIPGQYVMDLRRVTLTLIPSVREEGRPRPTK